MAVEHAHAMGSVEYYTESKFIEAARATMGSIDTDPATCPQANETIQAATIFDKDNCGLLNAGLWRKNVWVNPPGGLIKWSKETNSWIKAEHISEKGAQSSQKVWWLTLTSLWAKGQIRSACFVSFNLEILRWSQDCSSPVQAFPRCYPAKRMRFLTPGAKKKSAPAHPNLIAFLPPVEILDRGGSKFRHFNDVHRFTHNFAPLGLCEGPGV